MTAFCRDYIGGFGLGARILFSRMKPNVDRWTGQYFRFRYRPADRDSGSGWLRYIVVGKSPLTGAWGDANSGGDFGPYIKFAGYDAVFFTGQAAKPVYLVIDNGKAEIKDASKLWGKDSWDTEDMLKAELGKETEIACIGQSGEKLSLIAAVINNKGRRRSCRLGAVMGSKSLRLLLAGQYESSCC
jgi:aldehyde:ferredoxin oxidoreductase